MRTLVFSLIGLIPLLLDGCGYKFGYRHFAGPIVPATGQVTEMRVGDDRSIIFVLDRLEVRLRPITDDMLNRQFPDVSVSREGLYQNPYVSPNNPYTYGDWGPPEEDRMPSRFTVFLIQVKNYAFPKVRVDPSNVQVVATNGRRYPSLSFEALIEYYWPYAVGHAGNSYKYFDERKDILRSTLLQDNMIFSGQEVQGYIVFPPLDYDVEEFTVRVEEMVLRFDYRDEPVETVDVLYRFNREVYLAQKPRTEEGPTIPVVEPAIP